MVEYWKRLLTARARQALLVGIRSLTCLQGGEVGRLLWPDPVPATEGAAHRRRRAVYGVVCLRLYPNGFVAAPGPWRSKDAYKTNAQKAYSRIGSWLAPGGHYKQSQARGAVPKAQTTPEILVSSADGEQVDSESGLQYHQGAVGRREAVRVSEGAN